MSLGLVNNIALSGIQTAQAGLRTTSNNITNVNTEGYDRKVQVQEARLVGNDGAGVQVAEIRRVVDQFLAKQYLIAGADAGRYDTMAKLYERLEAVLGAPEANTTITGRLDQLFAGLGTLPIEPDSTVRRASALTDISTWSNEVSRLADQMQLLRQDADRQVVSAVEDINTQILRIHELNKIVAREAHLGNDITTLEEQREDALTKLSGYLDVSTFDMGNGFLGVTAAGGMVLVDTGYRQLDYTAAGTVSTQTVFNQIMVRKTDPDGLMIGTGSALDPNRRSGSLDGLLTMRDEKLPQFAESLGELASVVVDRLNAVHNANVAVPPPGTMVGRNTGLRGADELNFTGSVTFAMLDSSNIYADRVVIDFDGGTIDNGGGAVAIGGSTLDDLISAVNGATGFNSAVFSLSAGVLTFDATVAGNAGAVIAQDASDPSLRGGRGFSHFFGMNDLMEASGEAHFDTGFESTDSHALTAGGSMTLQLRGSAGQVAVEFDLTVANINARGTTFQAMLDELNASANMGNYVTFSMNSDGALVATPVTAFAKYDVVVTSDSTARGASSKSLSDLFGIGPRYTMDAARAVQVVDAITADTTLLALGRLDEGTDAVAGDIAAVSVGDNRGAVALHQVAQESLSFRAAGNLSATTGSLAEYSANVVSDIANNGSIADQFSKDRTAFASALQARITDLSGVNMDEELANMLIYQNAFAASARIITTVREMFDTLLNAV